jgi:hypothetical protein
MGEMGPAGGRLQHSVGHRKVACGPCLLSAQESREDGENIAFKMYALSSVMHGKACLALTSPVLITRYRDQELHSYLQ